MIEISYDNVMNGMNKGINMNCICLNMPQTKDLFIRACELWHIEGFSKVSRNNRHIDYNGLHLRFRSIDQMSRQDGWRGWRGIFLFHPEVLAPGHRFSINECVREMDQHNERYLDQWRA